MYQQHQRACMAGLVKVLGLLLLLCLSMSFFACTKKSSATDIVIPGEGRLSLDPKETLRLNFWTETPTLDSSRAGDTVASEVLNNVMEGLVDYNVYDPKMPLVPALALKWESSEHAKKWKFTLREDVKWTDGVLFTAQQVADAWKRLLDPATAGPYAYFLFTIKNAQAFNQGKIKDFKEVGVKVTAPNVIEVELEKSASFFPQLLAHDSTFPIRLDVIEKYGDTWTDPAHIQTLGAFKLKAWQHDKFTLLERNENYYGVKPTIKYVIGYVIPEEGTAIDMFDSGKLDVLDRIPSSETKVLAQRPEYHVGTSLSTRFYCFNVSKPPLDNPLVRKAIAYAIDRKQVVAAAGGVQVPFTSFLPPGVMGYNPDIGIHFDLAQAKGLLKKAGYGESKPVPKIIIEFNTNEDHQRIAENIQAQLKTNLGLNVELKNQEWKTYLQQLHTDAPQIYRSGWIGDYPDPDNFMNLMTSYSDNNNTRWKNKDYDALIEKAAGELDEEKRKSLYEKAQRMLVEEEVPVLQLYVAVTQYLIANRVEKFPQNLLERKIFKGIVLK